MSRTGKAVGSPDQCSGIRTITDRQTGRPNNQSANQPMDRPNNGQTNQWTDQQTDRQKLEVFEQCLWATVLLLDWHMLVHV